MKEHHTYTVDEAVETLIDYRGKTPPKEDQGVRLITAKVIKKGFIQDEPAEYISDSTYDDWMTRGIPQQWDTLLTTEAPLGEVAQIRSPEKIALAQRIILLRPDTSLFDSDYFFNLMKSPIVQAQLEARATGTTVRGIKQSELRKVELPAPPLDEQKRIGMILSNYDNLIESTNRRISILEEMSELLYREWFKKFRFPGHEDIELVDSPMGKIPEGWQVRKFTDIGEVLSGGTPKTKIDDYWDGSIPFYTPRDSHGGYFVHNTEKYITEDGLVNCSSSLYSPRTVFITARGTVGNLSMPSVDMAMNQSCYALHGKEGISQEFLFLLIQERIEYLRKNTGGATFDTIIIDTFRRMDVIVPPKELIQEFTEIVMPLFDLLPNLGSKNDVLHQTRDLLLPQFFSGNLGVHDIELHEQLISTEVQTP